MDGKHVFLPGRLTGITGGLDSHRAFSGPKFPPTKFSFRQLSANNPSFPVLSATNSDVPDYTANNFSGQGFHATNFFAPNFSANTFSGSESPAFAGVWDGGIYEHRSNLPQNSDGSLDSCAFPIGQTNDLGLLGSGIGQEGFYPPQNIGAWDGGIYEHGSNVPQNSYGGLDSCDFPIGQTDDLGLPGSGIGRDGLYPSHNFGVWDGGIYGHGFNLPQNSGPGFSATNSCAPNFQDFPATNFAGVWDGGIYEHGSNLPQISDGGLGSCAFLIGQMDDLVLLGSGIDRDGLYPPHNFDNTLEALTHVSPSLGISPKEAIGVQNENTRSESVEILQIEEVMPVDSSVQKPIGEEKVKRNGRPKIPIELADILQYDTVKDAAVNLKVSKSTLGRRIKELTKKTWSIHKRSEFDRKRACKKGRMQDKNTACACKSEI